MHLDLLLSIPQSGVAIHLFFYLGPVHVDVVRHAFGRRMYCGVRLAISRGAIFYDDGAANFDPVLMRSTDRAGNRYECIVGAISDVVISPARLQLSLL